MDLSLLLIVLALICFALAAFGVVVGRVGLVALGLFLWLLSTVVHAHIG